MQENMALGRAFLSDGATEQNRLGVPRRKCRPFADKGPQFGHFCDHHGHDFQSVDLIGRKFAGLFGLHDQHAKRVAQTLDRDAAEGGIPFFAGLLHIPKAACVGCIGCVDDAAFACGAPDKALGKP